MLFKIFVATLLMLGIMLLSMEMQQLSGYFAHIRMEQDILILAPLCAWFCIILFYDRIKRHALVLAIGVMTVVVLFYGTLVLHPDAMAHFDHNQESATINGILNFIHEQNSDKKSPSAAVEALINGTRHETAFIELVKISSMKEGCSAVRKDMTVKDLEEHLKQFDPHCIDHHLDIRRPATE